jgi:hypothetical protein
LSIKSFVGASLGALALSASLSGCAVVSDLGVSGVAESIEENASTLNAAHTKAMTAIIAVNVLRARDRWPTNYTTLSGIKSNPTMTLNGSANFSPLGLGNARLPFSGSSASIARNETANAEYSVNPFANNDKSQSLLKPIQPEMLLNYWKAGWPRETLMWLFVDAVTFAGENEPWYIDGDEFGAKPDASDVANVPRYVDLIHRAKLHEIEFEQLPVTSQDKRNCTPYDPVYLRETLGGAGDGLAGGRGGGGSMNDTINTVERLTGKEMVLAPDTRVPKPGEPTVAPDKFNRKLLLCDPGDKGWGFVDSKTGKVLASVRIRSFDDMIYFLGETLRSAKDGQSVKVGGVVLFQTYDKRDGKQYAVRIEHAGRVYFIAPQSPIDDTGGVKDVTGNVLSLLNQLYQLAQSDEFLRAPEARLR